MYRIIYISEATVPVGEYELESFLLRWRHNNERDGITGILLYSDSEGRFMQIIEGEKKAIQTLFHHIERDNRHCNLLKLADGPILQRSFCSWLMGFRVVSVKAFEELSGYIEPDTPLFQELLAQMQEPLLRELLLYFPTQPAHGLENPPNRLLVACIGFVVRCRSDAVGARPVAVGTSFVLMPANEGNRQCCLVLYVESTRLLRDFLLYAWRKTKQVTK